MWTLDETLLIEFSVDRDPLVRRRALPLRDQRRRILSHRHVERPILGSRPIRSLVLNMRLSGLSQLPSTPFLDTLTRARAAPVAARSLSRLRAWPGPGHGSAPDRMQVPAATENHRGVADQLPRIWLSATKEKDRQCSRIGPSLRIKVMTQR